MLYNLAAAPLAYLTSGNNPVLLSLLSQNPTPTSPIPLHPFILLAHHHPHPHSPRPTPPWRVSLVSIRILVVYQAVQLWPPIHPKYYHHFMWWKNSRLLFGACTCIGVYMPFDPILPHTPFPITPMQGERYVGLGMAHTKSLLKIKAYRYVHTWAEQTRVDAEGESLQIIPSTLSDAYMPH